MTYEPMENEHVVRDWKALLELSTEEVAALQASWEKAYAENMDRYRESLKERKSEVQEAVDFLTDKGVEVYKARKKNGERDFLAWFQNNIVTPILRKYPSQPRRIPTMHTREMEVDGHMLFANTSSMNIVELHEHLQRQYERAVAQERKNNELLRASIVYADKHELDVAGLDDRGVIRKVDQHAEDAFFATFTNDDEIYMDECDSCDLYFYGDHRCACGNRRIEVYSIGDILTGFTAATSAY